MKKIVMAIILFIPFIVFSFISVAGYVVNTDEYIIVESVAITHKNILNIEGQKYMIFSKENKWIQFGYIINPSNASTIKLDWSIPENSNIDIENKINISKNGLLEVNEKIVNRFTIKLMELDSNKFDLVYMIEKSNLLNYVKN